MRNGTNSYDWDLRNKTKISPTFPISFAIFPIFLPISKAQKAQIIFFGKKLEILKIFSFGKCRIVPKNVKEGTLLDLLTYNLLQNIKKLERVNKKIFEKVAVSKKIRKPFSLVRFYRLR